MQLPSKCSEHITCNLNHMQQGMHVTAATAHLQGVYTATNRSMINLTHLTLPPVHLPALLQRSLSWTVQEGALDFGFLGDVSETEDCGANCAYTNPNSPYGLTVLPMSPSERRVPKEDAATTPVFVKRVGSFAQQLAYSLVLGNITSWWILR